MLSGLEFTSVHANVELHVDGPEPDEVAAEHPKESKIEIEIQILLGTNKDVATTFSFVSEVTNDANILLGPRLGATFISVPCDVTFASAREIDFVAPIELHARNVALHAKSLIVRPAKERPEDVIIQCEKLESSLENIVSNVNLILAVENMEGIGFPTIKYTDRISQPPSDPDLRQKYFRLRRILCEFRSHSRGTLARYKAKIENERVLKNEIGEAVLKRLIDDGVLSLQENHYILDPNGLNTHLGVTWPALRKGEMPQTLITYLSGSVKYFV